MLSNFKMSTLKASEDRRLKTYFVRNSFSPKNGANNFVDLTKSQISDCQKNLNFRIFNKLKKMIP